MNESTSSFVHRYPFLVLESYCDFSSHMNHVHYLAIFEQARWELVTERGYGVKEIQKCQLAPIVLEVSVQYKRELRLREKAMIETRLVSYDRKISHVRQQIINESGKICCVADFKFALFDTHERKMINQTPEWLYAMGVEKQV